jgi:hypothetical protein
MKSASIPSLRVSAELWKEAESVLQLGESLSSFALEALTRSIEYRKSRREFVERGLLSAAEARSSGKYVSAGRVVEKLARKLAKAKRRAAPPGCLDRINDYPVAETLHVSSRKSRLAVIRGVIS